jgi:Tol biopolymer transport system component
LALRQLTGLPEGSFAFQPDWSPDGRRIAFSSNLGGGDLRLYTINRDGSDQRLVFDDQPGYNDLFPGYTPDGRRLVFQRCLPDDGVCAIYSVGLDGAALRALTQFKPGPNEANDYWPTVAPDGRIAFGRFGAGGITSQVYVMGAAGAGAHPITPPALLAVPGEWTPDSRQLVINSNGFGFQGSRLNAAIYRVRPDGTGLRRLTRPDYPHNDILPSPSPAGDRVVFVGDRLTAALAGRVGDRRRPALRSRPKAADRALRHAGRSPQARRPVTRTGPPHPAGEGPGHGLTATPVPVR